jgi:hypothetical protein
VKPLLKGCGFRVSFFEGSWLCSPLSVCLRRRSPPTGSDQWQARLNSRITFGRLRVGHGQSGSAAASLWHAIRFRENLRYRRGSLNRFCGGTDDIDQQGGWESMGTWLLPTSAVLAPIRFATKRCNSGCTSLGPSERSCQKKSPVLSVRSGLGRRQRTVRYR